MDEEEEALLEVLPPLEVVVFLLVLPVEVLPVLLETLFLADVLLVLLFVVVEPLSVVELGLLVLFDLVLVFFTSLALALSNSFNLLSSHKPKFCSLASLSSSVKYS